MNLSIKYNYNRGGVVRTWAKLYEEFGESIFYDKPHNKAYSSNLKVEAVEDCLSERHLKEIFVLNIKFTVQVFYADGLRRIISVYNLRIMILDEAIRKTTIEERKKIVAYCLRKDI